MENMIREAASMRNLALQNAEKEQERQKSIKNALPTHGNVARIGGSLNNTGTGKP